MTGQPSQQGAPRSVRLEPVRFEITQRMMADYPRQFGDYSSLHTDPRFAARTDYGGIIGWGVQPLFFLSLLDWKSVSPDRLAIRALSAEFRHAIRPGEPVSITATVDDIGDNDDGIEAEFEVLSLEAGHVATSGLCTLVAAPRDAPGPSGAEAAPIESMLPAPLTEHLFDIDDIAPGQTSTFDFRFADTSLRSLYEMIRNGSAGTTPCFEDWHASFDPRALLILPMFTTVMGMLMPGRRATCTNLRAEIASLPPPGRRCTMQGAVAFKSVQTRSILEKLAITGEAGEPIAEGEVTARVNAVDISDADPARSALR